MKLADTPDEQALLEELIETVKPPVPADCRHLHYLLSTPFRYDAPYPHGSRFRRSGMTPGVWYGSERVETAVAELAFYRLLFLAESPGTPWPRNVAEFTGFAADIATRAHLDLTGPDFDAVRDALEHPADYTRCQSLADNVRGAGGELIRYRSVRDPDRGCNVAVLTCRSFAGHAPKETRQWRIRIAASGVMAVCHETGARLAFSAATFAADPRLALLPN